MNKLDLLSTGLLTTISFNLLAVEKADGQETADKPWNMHVIDDSSSGADGVKVADINGDGLMDITTGWEEGNKTRVYLCPGKENVKQKWPAVTVGDAKGVEDATFADLDGDGATDVISSLQNGGRVVIHWAPKDKDYLKGKKWSQGPLPASRNNRRPFQWMYSEGMQIDGKHGFDIVSAGKKAGALIGWFSAPADARNVNEWKWHKLGSMGWVMSIILSDMDGDGDSDILYTDRKGKLRGCYWLENPGADKATGNWAKHPVGGDDKEVMFADLVDLDQDGLQDIVCAAKPKHLLWFRRLDKSGKKWSTFDIPYPDNIGSGKSLTSADINADGKLDLIVTCENAGNTRSGVVWMSYEDKPSDGKWNRHEVSGPLGDKYDRPEAIDVDGDGDLDIVCCEENSGEDSKGLGLMWYENPSK